MKFLFKERAQKGFPDEPLLAATQSKGVVRKEDYGARTVMAMKDLHLLKLVEKNDFVISLRSFQGGIEVTHARGIISPAYTILAPRSETLPGYFARFFKSPDFISSLTLFVTGIREGQNIDYERLSRAYMPLPPAEDQEAIGRFLDWASGRLDGAIRAKRKVIALLNEQKQAIILRAVTRGLDGAVQLKSSGVPWLGDIPQHWGVRRLKWALRLQRGFDLPAGRRKEGRVPVYSSGGHIDNHDVALATPPGIVIGRYGSTDAVFFVAEPYWPHNTALFTTTFYDNDPRWCFYLLRSISKGAYAGKSAVPGVDRKDLFDIVVPWPPLDEQQAVALAIDSELAHFQRSSAAIIKEIELLREYRTRLVADVVTGKLDVRAAAARLPDKAPPLPAESAGDFIDEIDHAGQEAPV